MASALLDSAIRYADLGLSIIALRPRTKNRPLGKWKPFQSRAADIQQLRKWFANGNNNIAVVLGSVSANLGCRDFDTMQGYQRWAIEYPDMAKMLPTVATSRGRHVYFRTSAANLCFVDLRTLNPPEDGEYRADSGHYCLLPPSQHPDGPFYHWLIPPDGELPFVTDVCAAGLLPKSAHVTEEGAREQRITEDNGITEAIKGEVCVSIAPPPNGPVLSASSVLSVTSDDNEIERAIQDNVPSAIGRRNRQVFELARSLKAIVRLADAPVDALKPYVRRWHTVGLARGVIGTEPFEETWIDFLHAWPKVRFAKDNQRILAIAQRAKDSALPSAAENYEGDGLRLLVAICREFQHESGKQPFFLACRTAALLLGLGENGQVTAWRWLGLLVHDGVLEEVERGERGKRRATRYRYTGRD